MDKQQFLSELGRLRPGSMFLSLMGYRNEYSEVSNYSIIFHMSYQKALERSLAALQGVVPGSDYESIAKRELIDSYHKSLDKMAITPLEELEDNYTRFLDENGNYIKGIKMLTQTGELHLYGLVNSKRIIIPGNYPNKADTRRPLTVAKDKLRKLCPVSKFRQFKLSPDQVDSISVQNLSLLPPDTNTAV
jgi:hypothetical protein